MRTEYRAVRHETCLVALFLVGNMLIGMPFLSAGGQSLSGFFAAAVLGFLSLLVLIPVCSRLRPGSFRAVTGILPKTLYAFLLLLAISAAIPSGWCCLRDFSVFVSLVMLPDASRPVVMLLFSALALLLAFSRKETLLKLSLLTFFGTVVCVLLLFLASAGQLRLKNLLPDESLTLQNVTGGAVPFLLKGFGQLFVVIAYLSLTSPRFTKKAPVAGTALGSGILLLCLCNILLVFGEKFTSQLDFPYSYAISIITVGQLFSRMEGITYFIYFFCCLIKLAVCIAVVRLSVRRFLPCRSQSTEQP